MRWIVIALFPHLQIELQTQLERWRVERPDMKFFFRPYSSIEACYDDHNEDNHDCLSNDDLERPALESKGVYRGSGGGDIDDSLSGESQPGQTLLFVHQEPWQQELLEKFGNFTMIDATYRTTMYDVALFFLVVPTNVGYTVVAEFCVQSEGAIEIGEALKVSCCHLNSFQFAK